MPLPTTCSIARPRMAWRRPTRGSWRPAWGFAISALITPEQEKEIRRGHLLLAFANAMQPGVFSLSGWDLMGALPLPRQSVAELMKDGDYRWINRGGIDLMGVNPDAKTSRFGLPRTRALYGPLPEQLKDPESFASQLKQMLAARKKYRIAEGELVAVPRCHDLGPLSAGNAYSGQVGPGHHRPELQPEAGPGTVRPARCQGTEPDGRGRQVRHR